MEPIRRNGAHLGQIERDAFIEVIVQGDASRLLRDGVFLRDKQAQIHQGTHVHGGPWVLQRHREWLNRYEALLQEVDPSIALRYWDWSEDPSAASNGSGGTVNLSRST